VVSNVLRAEAVALVLGPAAWLKDELELIRDMGGGKDESALAVAGFIPRNPKLFISMH
jgi:hypothetical protein